jgi:hypothetical protein
LPGEFAQDGLEHFDMMAVIRNQKINLAASCHI